MKPLGRITEENRKWWILIAMTSTISMMFLDQTILGVTLPTIHKALNTSSLALQWIVNAYLLALATLVLAMGRICDHYGPRKIFFLGTAIFALSSALCGMSMNAPWFIAARALQGVGGAMLYPSTTSIIFSSFPIHERGRAMGIFVSIGALFMSIGPFIGGLFTEYLTWRYVFWINIPIAIVGILLALISVPSIPSRKEHRLHPGSYTLFGGGISLLIFTLMDAGKWGWLSAQTLTLYGMSAFLFILFFLRNSRLEHPFIDLALFRKPIFLGGVLSTACNQFTLMITIFWAMYFQTVLGYSPLNAGLLTLFTNIPVLIAAPLSGMWLDKKGPRQPVVTGFCCTLSALLWFALVAERNEILYLIPTLILFGFGLPLIFTPAGTSTITQAPLEKRGLAIGINLTIRQFGGTLGIALISTLFLETEFTSMTKLLKAQGLKGVSALQFDGLLAHTQSAMNALNALPESAQEIVTKSAYAAASTAFSAINILAALVAICGLIAAATLFKRGSYPTAPSSK